MFFRICELSPEQKNIGTSSALVTVILLYWILEDFDPVVKTRSYRMHFRAVQ